MFDFGFQVVAMDAIYKVNLQQTSFYEFMENKAQLKNSASRIFQCLKPASRYTSKIDTKIGEVMNWNCCPICKKFEPFHQKHEIHSLIQGQFRTDGIQRESSTNKKLCHFKMYNNKSLHQHMLSKKDCYLHYLLLKYLESTYPDICKGYNFKATTPGKKRSENTCIYFKQYLCSTSLSSLFSLTR